MNDQNAYKIKNRMEYIQRALKQNEQSNQQPEEISEVQPPPPVTKKIQFNFSQEEIDSILNEHNESRIFSQSVTRVNGNVESIY